MYYSGIDIGSLTGKVVILDEKTIIASAITMVKKNPVLTATKVYEEALTKAGIKTSDVAFCVGTGYGRAKIPFAQKTLSEIYCHGRGAFLLDPSIRTVIDIGGQDCKVITLDDRGELKDFVMNEKCAAGTGRYLELMANLLNISLDELGSIALKSKSPILMTSVCSIYAQAEVLKYISRKARKEDISAGINKSMAERVVMMTKRMSLTANYTLSGGVAKNKGVMKYLEEILHIQFVPLSIDSQLVGAFGAAHFAKINTNPESLSKISQ